MKIAFLLTQSLDFPSGLGRFGPLAREMARSGHSVEVYSLHYDWANLQPKVFQEGGVLVNYVSQMHVRMQGARKIYFEPTQLLWVSWLATLRMTRAIWRSSAEILQICKPHPYNVLAARLAGRGRPIFCDCDDYEAEINVFTGRWQRPIISFFEDGITRYVKGITVNTQFNLERYAALGFPRERIVYVPNGVERERFNQPVQPKLIRQRWGIDQEAPLIVYTGSLGLLSHPVDLLLEAFRQVLQHIPAARLLMVGGGEDYDKLVLLAQQLGIDQATIFAGRQPPGEIPAYMAAATVSVDPVKDDLIAKSRSPLKIVESLVMGTPVVTSDIGDRRAVLKDGELGVLAPPGDSQALANGLLKILRNPGIRQQMSQAALAHKETWYWNHLIKDFMQVYPDTESQR